jgi:hypothetical protein
MRTTIVLAALAIGAATIGTSVAAPAGADPSNNCQTTGGVTVCAQGGDTGGGSQSAATAVPRAGGGSGGCSNAYGNYQNCNTGR